MNLLARAFAALGQGPSWREIGLVAESLRADEDAVAVLEAGTGGDEFRALCELASASGSSGFVALDLVTEFAYPGASVRRGEPVDGQG